MYRRVALLFLLSVTACAASPGSRSSGSSAATPTGRATPSVAVAPGGMSNPGATWDPVSKMALFFGGDTKLGPGNELWGWDGAAWRLLDDGRAEAPSQRDDAQLVADPERQVVVLIGGRTDRGGLRTVHNDTWEWDGTAWHERLTDGAASAPPARLHPVAGWDPGSRSVLYAGGVFTDESNATDTWAWDGMRWQPLSDAFPDGGDPPCRMALDPISGRPTLLAIDLDKQVSDGLFGTELWRWTGMAWETAAAGGPSISPVQPIATTADGLLLADGGGLQGSFFTWTWDGAAWTFRPGPAPPPRNGQVLVYDPLRHRVVMTGGWLGNRLFLDVWEWDGAGWTLVTPA